MNKTEASSIDTVVSVYTEQAVSAPETAEKDLSMNFFVVGGVINIVMITAYFIWAFRAWKRADKRGGR